MGMSYGTPETKLTSRTMRKIGLGHAMLAYLFSTGVLAVALNLLQGSPRAAGLRSAPDSTNAPSAGPSVGRDACRST